MSKKICCWLNQNGMSGFHIRNNGNMYPCVIRWINLTENKNQEHYIDYNHLSCEEIQELRLQFFDDINNGKISKDDITKEKFYKYLYQLLNLKIF